MYFIRPKHAALLLFKRNVPLQNLLNFTSIKNNASRCLHQNSKKHIRSNLNTSSLQVIRSKNADVRTIHSMSRKQCLPTEDEVRELMAVWPNIVRELTDADQYSDLPDINKWAAKVLQYNVPGGSLKRALSVVYTYKILYPYDDLSEEDLYKSQVLGWCTEMLQGYLLVIDDIQDQSQMRRTRKCWYLQDDVGLMAITDANVINTFMYQLLRTHFKSNDCYVDIIDLFTDITHKTLLGQTTDISITQAKKKKLDLDIYTMDRYKAIVKYKTSYYVFVLPVIAAMYALGIKDPEVHRQATTILLEMGLLFQIRDDYLDSYVDTEVTGKSAFQDIRDGKCAWPIVVALQRATPRQRQILEECFGRSDMEKINRVRQVYNELGISNTYATYEEETHNLITTHIQQVSRGLPPEIFLRILKNACPKVGRKN